MCFSDEEEEIKRLLKKQPFYNVLIEKPKVKYLNNADRLHKLPFYDELNRAKAFKEYLRSIAMK